MKEIRIAVNPKKAANILKTIINNSCEEGEEWFETDLEAPSLLDVLLAIKILEAADSREFAITDIPETEEEYAKVTGEIEYENGGEK